MDLRQMNRPKTLQLEATPNSIRWDEVNQVKYRFQALQIHSDVLDALVWNSPPLTRKEREQLMQTNGSEVYQKKNYKTNNILGLSTNNGEMRDYSSDYHSDDEVVTRSNKVNKKRRKSINETLKSRTLNIEDNKNIKKNCNGVHKPFDREDLLSKDKSELLSIIDHLQSKLEISSPSTKNENRRVISSRKVADIIKRFER